MTARNSFVKKIPLVRRPRLCESQKTLVSQAATSVTSHFVITVTLCNT